MQGLELPRAYSSWCAALRIAGLSIEDIARVMQCSCDTVRSSLASNGVRDDTYRLSEELREDLMEESSARDFAQHRGEKY